MDRETKIMENINKSMPIGQHIILDLYDCENVCKPWPVLREMFLNGLKNANFTVLSDHHHQFEPHGISGMFILAESHCSFHIWDELKYVSLDVYWCGRNCDDQKLINTITEYFNPGKVEYKYLDRGFI